MLTRVERWFTLQIVRTYDRKKWHRNCLGTRVIRIFLAFVITAVFVAGSAARAQEPDWGISGHVLRADTGAPIPDAKVSYRGQGDAGKRGHVLNPPKLHGEVSTGADGSYHITELPPGNYRIRALAPGFLPAAHIVSALPPAWNCRGCALSRSNDFNFQPDTIHLSTINTEAFRRVHSEGLLLRNVIGIDSVFSPNGELLAMALNTSMVPRHTQEVWLYRLPTGQLKLLKYPPVGSFYASGLLWQGDQLYMQAALVSPGGQPKQAFATASFDAETVKVLPTLPPAVQAAYARLEKEADGNSRFRVWGESSCEVNPAPHCGQGMVLAVEDKSTRKQRIVSPIALGEYSFDPKNSVIIFISDAVPPSGWKHGVTTLNLLTHRQQLTMLPGDGPINLMADRRVQDGYLIAYWTEGDCDPASMDAPESSPSNGLSSLGVTVCLATIPSP